MHHCQNLFIYIFLISYKFFKCIKLDISQGHIEEKDEFDREKEEQDHILKELVPKLNKEATKLIDVYKLEQLIDLDVLESLNDEALKILRTTSEDLP